MIDLQAYFERIAYEGPKRTDFETLRGVHRAHALAISYENLDVQLKRSTTTDATAAFAKIVGKHRGGWCYEMNGVLGLALEQLGFKVTRLSANGSNDHSHLVLTVDLDATYVCDVGFADGPIEPYPLVDGAFVQDGFEYRVERESAEVWRLHNHRFGLTPGFRCGGPDEAGLSATCRWLQTSPESPFVQHVTVVRRTPTGFTSLIDRILRRITPTGVTRHTIENPEEWVYVLKSEFSLDVPETAALWPQLCQRHEAYLRESAARKAATQNA
jgi:N-hydroxyarylamine O-acetyltransferase